LIFKPTVQYFENGKKTVKGNVDAELVLHAAAIEFANYDKAIIVSGDGDFACLLEFLLDNKKLKNILTPNHKYSKLLKPFSSHIIHISQLKNLLNTKRPASAVETLGLSGHGDIVSITGALMICQILIIISWQVKMSNPIHVKSIAYGVSECDPIELARSVDDTRRLVFLPIIHNNKEKNGAVTGTFVYQRKLKTDKWDKVPSGDEQLSRLKAGEGYRLELSTDAVTKLVSSLMEIESIAEQVRSGSTNTTFVPTANDLAPLLT
jgi:hypothetical protein